MLYEISCYTGLRYGHLSALLCPLRRESTSDQQNPLTKGQQGSKFPVAWYPTLWEIETGYRLFHYRSPAGYHFLQHLCNFHHKGYRIFGKGYHIEKTINPSCYQEYLTNFEAWTVMRNFDPLEGNFRWKYWRYQHTKCDQWFTLTKGQLCRTFVFSLLLTGIGCWTNSPAASYLRHDDAYVMLL